MKLHIINAYIVLHNKTFIHTSQTLVEREREREREREIFVAFSVGYIHTVNVDGISVLLRYEKYKAYMKTPTPIY